jgi:hypothetical protein
LEVRKSKNATMNDDPERKAVLAELGIEPGDIRAFETILLDFAEYIVDNPAKYPVTIAYTAKHKPKRREWPRKEKKEKPDAT